MDRYFSQSSAEYKAHAHIADYVFWDANIGPTDIGLCAAYAALSRFVKGEDLYIPPRDVYELQAILRNYSDHVVNSVCSQVVSRVQLRKTNGYALAREQSARSLHAVLSKDNNLQRLVALHSPSTIAEPIVDSEYLDGSSTTTATPRHIRSN